MTPKPLARFWKTLDEIPEATTDRRDWSLRLKEDWPAAESYLTPLGVRAKGSRVPRRAATDVPAKW
jgi:Ser/Thr protein kinase RdoA (MazF antagonist)